MKNKINITAGMLLGLWVSVSWAEIQILGLFKDKVVMQMDGKPQVIQVGEEKEGIKVISADSHQCTLQIHGKTQTFQLGEQINSNFTPATAAMVRVAPDERGMYHVEGAINGHPLRFIVDTGASFVSLSVAKAIALDLPYQAGKIRQVETAGGKAKAYLIDLPELSVGEIKVYNVPALVIENNSLQEVLLGMSFLQRVEMKDQNQILEFRQKYK